MSKIIPSLSKIWLKVVNLETSLFPQLKESLRIEEFSSKESKLIKILDFAEIENNLQRDFLSLKYLWSKISYLVKVEFASGSRVIY